ncbi:hypothetical protein [Schaedlerella arabinosiphila]
MLRLNGRLSVWWWAISSNREMGEGYADILAEPDTGDMGIIIEVKLRIS